MKLHISNPATGCNKKIEIDSEVKLHNFMDKRISHEVLGDDLGDEFKGYVFKITGGCDRDGFPMKQGVLTNGRVRLLLERGGIAFQRWRGRTGERRRKSVRGCIVGPDLSVINLAIVKQGEQDLPGLTTEVRPRTMGPKRASRIRKLLNLPKEEDVRKHVIKHKKKIGKKEGAKEILVGPKIQRLVTPARLRRKKQLLKRKIDRRQKTRENKKEYSQLLAKRKAEALERADASKKQKTEQ